MTLIVDLGSLKFIQGVGFASTARALEFKRGDSGKVKLCFVQDGQKATLPEGTDIIFELKESGEYDAPPLIRAEDFAPVSEGSTQLQGTPYFATAAITAALDGKERVSCMAEVTYRKPGEGWTSTATQAATIFNDVIKEGEELPELFLGGVPAVAARASIDFDTSADMEGLIGSFTVGETAFGLHWAGGDPYIGLPNRLSFVHDAGLGFLQIARAIRDVINTGAVAEDDVTIVGSIPASSEVSASVEVDSGVVRLVLESRNTGSASDGLYFAIAATGNGDDVDTDGALAGGKDPRALEVADFLPTFEGGQLDALRLARVKTLLGIIDQVVSISPWQRQSDGWYPVLGPLAGAFEGPNNFIFPERQGHRWLDENGDYQGAHFLHWHGHDTQGGEGIWNSPWRLALIGKGPMQIGANDALPDSFYPFLTSGLANANYPAKRSKAFGFQTRTLNDGANFMAWQADPVSADDSTSVLSLYTKASVAGSDNRNYQPIADRGKVTGDKIIAISETGTWNPGIAPAFVTATDDSVITLACDRHKTVQTNKVTLSGNRTLDITGLEEGMRGVFFVTQDANGSRLLSLPGSSATQPGFALSTASGSTDRLSWEYVDGVLYWKISANFQVSLDTDAEAFLTAANISDGTITAATNSLVVGLKNAGIWGKLYAIYPFVGGTALAHSQNLIGGSAANLIGTITHDANGVTGDGTTGHISTGVNLATTAGDQNSSFLHVYNRTILPKVNGYFIGSVVGGQSGNAINRTSSFLNCRGPNANTLNATAVNVNSDFRGHLVLKRADANTAYLGKNDGRASVTASATSEPNADVFVLSTGNSQTDANIAFAAIGGLITDAEEATYKQLVTNFQTALGRAV